MRTETSPNPSSATEDSRLFRALADPCRLGILQELVSCCGAPRTVSECAACCSVDLSVVSRHLATLRDAGILEARKVGREVHYTVRYQELSTWFRNLADAIDRCCSAPDAAHGAATQPPTQRKENPS